MAGISRIHGGVVAETLHGGYQTTYFLVAGTAVGTADTVNGTTGAITEGTFQKAIRAIQLNASTVFIGPRADNGFIVGLDTGSAAPTGPAYDTDSSPTIEERLQVAVRAATGVSGATVAIKTLTLADFA
jgi:hypothetical protein